MCNIYKEQVSHLFSVARGLGVTVLSFPNIQHTHCATNSTATHFANKHFKKVKIQNYNT